MVAIKKSWVIKRAWLILYLFSLVLPAAYSDYQYSTYDMYHFTGYFYGLSMLLMGMLEFMGSIGRLFWTHGVDTIPWLANPMVLIASISFHAGKRYFFFVAILLAFVFATVYSFNPVGYCCEDGRHIPATPHIGYYVWLLSIVMLFVKGWHYFYPSTEPD